MFTGLVQSRARVATITPIGGDVRLTIDASGWKPPTPVTLGDSISISGACLTVVEMESLQLAFDVSRETLDKTTLGDLVPGALVNLEPSLRAGDVLGGHLVTGHVDALGEVLAIRPEARSHRLEISLPQALQPLVASKGSVCMDGVSLTVNEVSADRFGVNIIPHTWEVTSFAEYTVGRRVNLEADVLARYVARQLAVTGAPVAGSEGVSQ